MLSCVQGKDKPTYNPKKESGDVVIVVNASHVHFTHDKWKTQLYRWHTGGGLGRGQATGGAAAGLRNGGAGGGAAERPAWGYE